MRLAANPLREFGMGERGVMALILPNALETAGATGLDSNAPMTKQPEALGFVGSAEDSVTARIHSGGTTGMAVIEGCWRARLTRTVALP